MQRRFECKMSYRLPQLAAALEVEQHENLYMCAAQAELKHQCLGTRLLC
jgi:hypothetical protein